MNLKEWVLARIDVNDNGCWIWNQRRDRDGYGRARFQGRTWQAHRAVYTALVGEIPAGAELDHLCRVTSCVNPAHLEAVDRATNIHRSSNFMALNAQKAACHRGHEFTAENTYRPPGSPWQRICRECRRVRRRSA